MRVSRGKKQVTKINFPKKKPTMVDRTDRQFHYDQPGSAKLLGLNFN
jgi:hypothetical protein